MKSSLLIVAPQPRPCLRPTTKVIFITGFSGFALRAGASIPKAKVLAKPFHPEDLVLEVERLFAKESYDQLK